MNTLATSNGWNTASTDEAISLPRHHVAAIAALVCIPIPLLSLGATLVPLPQLLERAAASFVSFAVPSSGEDRLIREKKGSRALEIVYRPEEPPLQAVAAVASAAPTDARASRRPKHEAAQANKRTAGKGTSELRSQPLTTGDEQVGNQPPGSTGGADATNPPGKPVGGSSSGSAGSSGGMPNGGGTQDGGAKGGGSSGTAGGGGSSGGGTAGGSGKGKDNSGDSGGSSGGGSPPSEPPKETDPGSGAGAGSGSGSGGSAGSGSGAGSGAGSGGNGGGNGPTAPPGQDPTQPPRGQARP